MDLIAVLEWSELKSQGYHLHALISKEQEQELKQKGWHISNKYYCINAVIKYLAKFDITKQLFVRKKKVVPVPTQLELPIQYEYGKKEKEEIKKHDELSKQPQQKEQTKKERRKEKENLSPPATRHLVTRKRLGTELLNHIIKLVQKLLVPTFENSS